jgi:membrane protein YqaA with SNARE-associated domain
MSIRGGDRMEAVFLVLLAIVTSSIGSLIAIIVDRHISRRIKKKSQNLHK